MNRPYRLTKIIKRWLDINCPWIHISVYIESFNYDVDAIFIQGYDDVHVLDNKYVEVQPSYMVDIHDPDFFRKLARRLGLSKEIRQMDRLLDV